MKEIYKSECKSAGDILYELTDSNGNDRAAQAFINGEEGWEFCFNITKGILGYGDDGYDWENAGDEWGEVDEIQRRSYNYFTFTVIQTVEE